MASSKRMSTIPAVPKPPTTLAPTLIIADNALLTGTHRITLGDHTVVHPRSKLSSAFAPIMIGSGCIISERSTIGMQSRPPQGKEGTVAIENGVVVEVGAVVEGRSIGEGSLIETNSKIGQGAVIGKHCRIGPFCEVGNDEIVPDFTVIYGDGLRRVDASGIEELRLRMVCKQTEILRKLLPSNLAKFQ